MHFMQCFIATKTPELQPLSPGITHSYLLQAVSQSVLEPR